MTFRAIFGIVVGLALTVAGVVLFAWLLWWLWTRREEEAQEQAAVLEIEAEEPVETRAVEIELEVEEVEEAEAPSKPDDLKVVEGIGPKISSVLQEAGIATFAQLADATAGQIEQILEAADPRLLRLADPATWPEQAALAASGQWDALEALQDELKGGKRE